MYFQQLDVPEAGFLTTNLSNVVGRGFARNGLAWVRHSVPVYCEPLPSAWQVGLAKTTLTSSEYIDFQPELLPTKYATGAALGKTA